MPERMLTVNELDPMPDLSAAVLYSAEVRRIPFIPREEQAAYVEAAKAGDGMAGNELVLNCLNWTMTKPFIITHIYDKLLRGDDKMPVGLYHLHLLTAAQLTKLHYGKGSYKYVRQLLNDLADNGYVVIDAVPRKFARGPNIYSLGVKGIQYLRDIGLDVDKSVRASKETGKGYQHIEHMLELNDVFIAALRISTLDKRLYVARYEHERELKRTPYKTMVQGTTFGLVPDGFFDLHVKREGQSNLLFPVCLEHDQGWERESQFRAKIAAYRAFIQSGAYKERFGVKSITVIITTFKAMDRVMAMRDWTWDEVHIILPAYNHGCRNVKRHSKNKSKNKL